MFVNRKVYERNIEGIKFKGNETKGTVEAFDSNNNLIQKWDTVADNSAEFNSITRKMFNEINKNSFS